MKTRMLAIGGLISLLGIGTTFGIVAHAGAPVDPVAGGTVQKKERHPELRHALRALENAKMALIKANRDFGGHRAKAQEATELAITETKAAIAFDQK